MAVIPAGYGQATIHFTGANVPHGAAIVFGFQAVASSDADVAASYIYGAVGAQVDNMCTSDVTMVQVDTKLGPNDTGPQGSFAGTPVVGAVGSTSLSPGSAILVEKNTAAGGRRARGRMFWPGVYDGWVDDNGALGSGIVAQINGFMATMLTTLDTDGFPMVVLHSPSYTWTLVNGQPRRVYGDPGSVPAPNLVTSLTADPVISSQRRRLR